MTRLDMFKGKELVDSYDVSDTIDASDPVLVRVEGRGGRGRRASLPEEGIGELLGIAVGRRIASRRDSLGGTDSSIMEVVDVLVTDEA